MPDVFPALPALNRSYSVFSRGRHGFPLPLVTILGVLLVPILAVPAFAEAQMKALESVHVGTGKAVRLKTSLEAGQLFMLKASGSVQVGGDRVDADGSGSGAAQPGQDSPDGVAVTDIGADGAVPAQKTEAQAAPNHWVTGSDHTDYMLVSGTGTPLSFRFLAPRNQTGKGAITISVFRLSPAPALLPTPIETIQVPVLDRSVATSLTTRLGALYLLQASGSGKVGGGGLGQGDAEFMDYKADGTGAVDIGDAHTDYGLGVDEADQSVSPRLHKWGAWRQDHTYYLLFAGTGQPIHFFFYDVKGGYGDNSATDTLTVKIFPVP
jgi:hypothetical protein